MSADPHHSPLRRIELALAREPSHPLGDRGHRFTIVVPLDEVGRIDESAWACERARCRVVRRCEEQEHRVGHLVPAADGGWRFDYDLQAAGDDEDLASGFAEAQFTPGSYVTVEEDDGVHTFRVVSVAPL